MSLLFGILLQSGAILYVLLNLVVSLLTSLLVTRPLMARGHGKWGFIAGLSVLVFVLGLGQLYFAQHYRAFFSRTGPCSTCCELCGLTFLLWWFCWGIGCMAYLILSARFANKFDDVTPLPTPRWLKRCLTGGILVIILGSAGFNFLNSFVERSNAHNSIVKIETSILSGNFTEIGSLMLSQTAEYWWNGNITYAEGINFSADGNWFSLRYKDKLEIWRMPDLVLEKTFRPDSMFHDSLATFSPDSTKLAVWIRGSVSVYSLVSDPIELIWESPEKNYDLIGMAVDRSGSELVLANSGTRLETLDMQTGSHIDKVAIPILKDYWTKSLSQDGEYVITASEHINQIYDRHNGGSLVHEFEKPSGSVSLLPNNDVLLLDCEHSTGKILDIETGDEVTFTIDIRVCERRLKIFSPDSRLLVSAYDQKVSVWDLLNQSQVGDLSVESAITAVAMMPNQRILVLVTADGRLHFFASKP
jgi:hypothetical protein